MGIRSLAGLGVGWRALCALMLAAFWVFIGLGSEPAAAQIIIDGPTEILREPDASDRFVRTLSQVDDGTAVLYFGKVDELRVYDRGSDGSWVETAIVAAPVPLGEFGSQTPDFVLAGDVIVVQWNDGEISRVLQRDQGGPNTWGEVATVAATTGSPRFFDGSTAVFAEEDELVIVAAGEGWTEQARLSAPGAGNVALDAGVLVVGAPEEQNEPGPVTGLAYVFEQQVDGTWVRTATLERDLSPTANWDFGFDVAVEDEIIVVGAPREAGRRVAGGSAFVYARNDGEGDPWIVTQELEDPDERSTVYFGGSVDLVDGVAIVESSLGQTQDQLDRRALFHRYRTGGRATDWAWDGSFEVQSPAIRDDGVWQMDFDGSTLVSGHDATTHAGEGSGFAAIWDDAANAPVPTYVFPDRLAEGQGYNSNVEIDGDTALLATISDLGHVDVVERAGGTGEWTLTARLFGPSPFFFNTSPDDSFASSPVIALDGDTAVVAGFLEAYVYERDAGGVDNWGLVRTFAVPRNVFGRSIDLDGDTLAIRSYENVVIRERNRGGSNNWGRAARFDDVARTGDIGVEGETVAFLDSGTVRIVERNPAGSWNESAVLDDADLDFSSLIGVAIDEGRIVVGGFDSGPAGAIEIYQRNSDAPNGWVQRQRLVTAGGAAVAIDAQLLVAGADDQFLIYREADDGSFEIAATIPIPPTFPEVFDVDSGKLVYLSQSLVYDSAPQRAAFVVEFDGGSSAPGAIIQIEQVLDTSFQKLPQHNVDFRFDGSLGPFRLDNPSLGDDGDGVDNLISFEVPPGTYSFRQTQYKNFDLREIDCFHSAGSGVELGDTSVALTVGRGDVVRCTFVNDALYFLSVRVFEGSGRNGGTSEDDTPYADWPVEVRDTFTGEVVASGVTGDDGVLRMRLVRDRYEICVGEGPQPFTSYARERFADVTGSPEPGPCRESLVPLISSDSRFIRFKAVLVEDLRGRTFEDVDGDARFDAGTDRTLADVQLELRTPDGAVVERTAASDADGRFRFRSFEGAYDVCLADDVAAESVAIRVGTARTEGRCAAVEIVDGVSLWVRIALQGVD